MTNTFLFILSTHNSGSSKLIYQIGDCAQVSLLRWVEGWHALGNTGLAPTEKPKELGFERLFSEHLDVFANSDNYDWPGIKAKWMEGWNQSLPILAQKTPCIDLFNVDEIVANFQPVKFIILTRDPYATVEGTMRRCKQNSGYNYTAERCAKHWLECLKQIDYASRQYREQSMVLSYEDICAKPDGARQALAHFCPELEDLKLQGWQNKNPLQLKILGEQNIAKVRSVISENELVQKYGYFTKS